MKSTLSRWLTGYALFVILVSVAATMYTPVTGVIGFNPHAKSALIAGGACGILTILWAALLGKGMSWARIAAIVTTSLFTFAFGMRAVKGWQAVVGGDGNKWYAATAIGLLTIASLVSLIKLLKSRA